MVRVCLRFCFLLVLAVSATVWGTGCSKSEGPATCQTNNDCIDGQRCVKRACKEVETQTRKSKLPLRFGVWMRSSWMALVVKTLTVKA